jgi:uncharacterized FAD-dependent dehydrogenase
MTPDEVRARVDEIGKLAEAGDLEAVREKQRHLMFEALCAIGHGFGPERELAVAAIDGVLATNKALYKALLAAC